MEIEKICAAVHLAYCTEILRQGKEPYWTGGDYNKLNEATKEFGRVTIKAVLDAIGYEKLQAENAKRKAAIKDVLGYFKKTSNSGIVIVTTPETIRDILEEALKGE